MPRSCASCNHVMGDSSRFCDQCGAPQAESAPPQADGGGDPAAIAWGVWQDPTEGAFAVRVPRGWGARGGIDRGGGYGLPTTKFETQDPSGCLRYRLGGGSWQFYDSGVPDNASGMWGGLMKAFAGGMASMSGGQALSYRPADAFAHTWLLPMVQKTAPDVTLLRMDPRPDVVAANQQNMAQELMMRGMAGYQVDCSAVEAVVRYTEGGVLYLERVRLQTTRCTPGMMGWMGGGGSLPWFAEIAFSFRAPHDRFGRWEPVLRAIADSVKTNPAWQQAQLNADNARALASQQQMHMRQQQISQTLSQTSDIVADTYWSSQQIRAQHEAGRAQMGQYSTDWQHNYSNAILGWEDRVDDSGKVYSIEAGHERVWRDNSGNLHYGGWGSNPDPTWHELKPQGQ